MVHTRPVTLLRWNKRILTSYLTLPAYRNRTCHFCPHIKVRMSVSPLKPTPEPISGGKSHWPVIATITELCGRDSNPKLLAHQCVSVTPPHIIYFSSPISRSIICFAFCSIRFGGSHCIPSIRTEFILATKALYRSP